MIEKVLINDYEYKYLKAVPEMYYEFYNETNEVLEDLRKAMPTWGVDKSIIDKADITIGFVDYEKVNAGAYNGHAILITAGLCHEFYKLSKDLTENKEFCKLFDISESNISVIRKQMYNDMIRFVVLHEFSHVVHGHYLFNNYYFEINNTDTDANNENFSRNWTTQLQEYDADRNAMLYSCAIVFGELTVGNLKTTDFFNWKCCFDNLVLSVYLVFYVFARQFNCDLKQYIDKPIYEFNHPHPGIRIAYCVEIMAYFLSMNKDVGFVDNIVKSVIDMIFQFESLFLKIADIEKCLFSVSFTEKGSQHIIQLNNDWEKQISKYETKSLVKIYSLGELSKWAYIIDKNGNINIPTTFLLDTIEQ